MIDHNLPFDRFTGVIRHNGVTYIPDFLIDNNTIIEIKGFENYENVAKKTAAANANGYVVNLLKKENLQKEFNWVSENYHYKNVWELYDDYTPTYTYTCNFCNESFTTDKVKNTDHKFCSRKCSGKWRGIKNMAP